MFALCAVALPAPATAVTEPQPPPATATVEPDGTPEGAYSAQDLPTWQTNGTVWALASAGPVVFAGGTFSEISPPTGSPGAKAPALNLASFDAVSGSPASCRPAITTTTGVATVRALAVSPDQKTLYIAGHFTHVAGVAVARLAALDIATCSVTPFRAGSIPATVRALAVTDQAVYFGGDFSSVRGAPRAKFAAVSRATGQLLPWKADADKSGRAIDVSPDGSLVAVGGDFFTVNGAEAHSFAVTDATSGQLVKAYPQGFIPDTSVTKTITNDPAGFYIGNEGTGGGVFDGRFAVDFDGLEQRWRDTCLGATQALAVHADVLYAANHAHDCEGMGWQPDGRRVYLTAESTQGPKPISWVPELNDGIGEGIGPRALVRAEVGDRSYLWTGGEFTSTNGKSQRGLTRFGDGRTTAPASPSRVTAESTIAGTVQVRWRASLDADSTNLDYAVYRNSETQPFARVSGPSYWWQLPQMSVKDPAVEAGKSYTYRVEVSDGTSKVMSAASAPVPVSATDVPYSSAVLKDGASLYWRYNEQGDVQGADSSSGNRKVNFMKSPALRSGGDIAGTSQGYSIGFDGANSYAYSDTMAAAPATYSVETWFKTDTTEGGKIIGYGNGQPTTGSLTTRLSGSYDRQIYMSNSGQLLFGAFTGSAVVVKTSSSYNDSAWHHVVATQDASGMNMYVDGKLVGQNANSSAQGYRGSWRVGGDNLNGWPDAPTSNFFRGQIDETAVYPGALSATQAADHYRASGRTVEVPQKPEDGYGAAVFGAGPDLFWRFEDTANGRTEDSGPLGNDGLLQGSAAPVTTGRINSGLGFGADGFVSSSVRVSGPASFSSELWFKTASLEGGRLIGFVDNASGRSSNYDRHVYVRSDGRLVFGVWTGSESVVVTDSSYNDGKWHHVVATQSPSGMSLFTDGRLVGSNSQASAQTFDGVWKVGSDNIWGGASTSELAGDVDEVAVYSRALTPAEVSGHYAAAPGVPDDSGTPPAAPRSVSASVEGRDVVVSWSDTSRTNSYRLYRAAADGSSSPKLVGETAETTLRDVDPGQGTWRYSVKAVDAKGRESIASDVAEAVVPAVVQPVIAPPTSLTTARDDADVVLAWTAGSNTPVAARFSVYRASSRDFSGEIQMIGETTEPTYRDVAPGAGTWYYRVTAVDGGGVESAPSDVAEATVKAVDTTPPATPAGVSVSSRDGGAYLTWTASTDDSEPVTYEVHRSIDDAFAPTSATLIGDGAAPQFFDSGAAQGTYFYRVIAIDAATNRSIPSAPVRVTTGTPPVEVSVAPLEDAMVNEAARTTNLGSSSYLASRKSTGYESYLRFKMPVIPKGMTLAKASLSLQASNQTFAGSAEPHVVTLTEGDWAENDVTWNTRPRLGTGLGSFVAPASPNQRYSTDLAVTGLAGAGSEQLLNIAVSGSGADNFWFWSREQTNPNLRPKLTLTFKVG